MIEALDNSSWGTGWKPQKNIRTAGFSLVL